MSKQDTDTLHIPAMWTHNIYISVFSNISMFINYVCGLRVQCTVWSCIIRISAEGAWCCGVHMLQLPKGYSINTDCRYYVFFLKVNTAICHILHHAK